LTPLHPDREKKGVAYLQDELRARTIEAWCHTVQNHSMIQQRSDSSAKINSGRFYAISTIARIIKNC
jgi:hypothetical protein